MPLIQYQDSFLAVDNQRKLKALQRELFIHLLSNSQKIAWIFNWHKEVRNHLIKWQTYNIHEIERAIFQVGNNSASINRIPLSVIKKGWQCIKKKLPAYFIAAWKKISIFIVLKTLLYVYNLSLENALVCYHSRINL